MANTIELGDTIRIVHISDTHISESFDEAAMHAVQAPHRAGHDRGAFLALDQHLRDESDPWDILLVTGDVTRIGDNESVRNAFNWIQNRANTLPGTVIGLERREGVFVVPGNHDRYGGKLYQGDRAPYYSWFPLPRTRTQHFSVRGTPVRIHCFDSSDPRGSFGRGHLDPTEIQSVECGLDGLDIALLHHHPFEPPHHPRDRRTELDNGTQVASALLGGRFHFVAFGHTHRSFLEMVDVPALVGLVSDRRPRGRIARQIVPRIVLDCLPEWAENALNTIDSRLTDYDRIQVNKKFVTFDIQFRYLFLRQIGAANLKDPSSFKTVRGFRRHVESIEEFCIATGVETYAKFHRDHFRALRKLISMAPSACQLDAERYGFHRVDVRITNQRPRTAALRRFEYCGNGFVQVKAAELREFTNGGARVPAPSRAA